MRAQRLFRLAVGLRRIIDEMHRPAMHDAAKFAAGRLLGPALHGAEIVRDDVAKADTPAPNRVVSSMSAVPSTDFRLRIRRPGTPST